MNSRRIRVRFAPSPTGPLHIGGVRTALFNYLFAKKHGGDFLLRIEDTDQDRYVPGAENYIIESLLWCGIEYNEGVGKGGEYGPYRQSDRKPIYRQYADYLINNGFGYYAFDTKDDLENLRKEYENDKKTFQYDSTTRKSLRNSLTMSESEVKLLLDSGEHVVIRLKVPENELIHIKDLIRGEVVFHSTQVDDKVLFKSDGMPTYHLANVVDDYLMKISHVIRGEEWLPSTPLHVLLYRYLGWESEMPQFAHLPLILKPDGKGKLSKRDGDKGGFPVFPLLWTDPKTNEISSGYREAGYFKEAFINMLAFLGWNPGTEQEIFLLDELVAAFSLEKVGKAGAKFDPKKAMWFNQNYLRTKSEAELALLFQEILKEKQISVSNEFVEKICKNVKERVSFVKEIWGEADYFFNAPASYDEKIVKKFWKPEMPQILSQLCEFLQTIEPFDSPTTETEVKKFIEENQLQIGQIANTLRLVLVGASRGPHLFDIMELLGKEETIRRIENGKLRVVN